MLVRLLGGEKKEGSGLFGVSILPTYVEREAVPIRPQLITRPVNRRQGSTGRVRQELDRKVDTLLSRAAPRRIHFCPLRLFFFLPILAAYGGRRAVARPNTIVFQALQGRQLRRWRVFTWNPVPRRRTKL